MTELYTDPFDFLENAAHIQKLIGHLQAVQLEQLAAYAHATEHLPVPAPPQGET